MRIVMLAALIGCGPLATTYERTAPRRVDVTKQATPPQVELDARFIGEDTVELIAKRASDVRITRVVHYSAAELEMTRGNPALELAELPLGLILVLLGGPSAWETPFRFRETSTSKTVLHTNYIVALLNPFQTSMGFHVRAKPTSEVDVFVDPPVVREVHMRLPAPALPVIYRVLDEGEHEIAKGTVYTDAYGRVTIPKVAGAVALDVIVDGKPSVVPIAPLEEVIAKPAPVAPVAPVDADKPSVAPAAPVAPIEAPQ